MNVKEALCFSGGFPTADQQRNLPVARKVLVVANQRADVFAGRAEAALTYFRDGNPAAGVRPHIIHKSLALLNRLTALFLLS